jgi:hypothetical protein
VSAGTCSGELSGNDLVHHGFIRLNAEDIRVEVDLTRTGAVCRIEFCG